MDRHALVRWAGVAAIAAGTLHGVTALIPAAQTPAIHLAYLAIDLLLLLAVVGLFTFQREQTGGWGALGTLLATSGGTRQPASRCCARRSIRRGSATSAWY
jgi:hypothetical protein